MDVFIVFLTEKIFAHELFRSRSPWLRAFMPVGVGIRICDRFEQEAEMISQSLSWSRPKYTPDSITEIYIQTDKHAWFPELASETLLI